MQRLFLAILAALVTSVLATAGAAHGALTCDERVLRDWARDGRIDRSYRPPCYSGAIDLLPTDLRDYTDAEDVIARALASAVRADARSSTGRNQAPGAGLDRNDASLPIQLAVLGGLSLALLLAGSLGHLSRRRHVTPSDDAGA